MNRKSDIFNNVQSTTLNHLLTLLSGVHKCDSRYPSVAALDSDGMIVMSEDIKFTSTDPAVNSKGYAGASGDNTHGTKHPTVKRKGFIVPFEETKYASTVSAVSSEGYEVSSRGNKHSRTVSAVKKEEYPIPGRDTNTYLSVRSEQ